MKKYFNILIILILLSLFFIYQNKITNFVLNKFLTEKKVELTKKQEIANLYKNENNVRLKQAKSSIWYPTHDGEKLSFYDTISTGLSSFTNIKFKNNYKLNLNENSLITLTRPLGSFIQESAVELFYGDLELKNEEDNNSKFKINFGKITAETKGKTEFKLKTNKKDNTTKLEVKKGNVKLKDKLGNVIVIKEGDKKLIENKSLESLKSKPVEKKKIKAKTIKRKAKPKIKKRKPRPKTKIKDLYSAIAKKRDKLSTCYKRGKKRIQGIPKANVKLDILKDGSIKKAKILKTNIKEKEVIECIEFWLEQVKIDKILKKQESKVIELFFK
jgi:hypothetical protein